MPTGEKTWRRLPPQAGHTLSGSSSNRCTASTCSPHVVQAYWYVGTGPPSGLRALALAPSDCQILAYGGGQPGQSRARLRGHPDPVIERSGRHAVEQLAVVEQRDRGDQRADLLERTVVTTAAAAQPIPAAVGGQ